MVFWDCLWLIGLFYSQWSYWIRQSQSDKTVFALRCISVLTKKITKNVTVLSFKNSPRKPLRRRPPSIFTHGIIRTYNHLRSSHLGMSHRRVERLHKNYPIHWGKRLRRWIYGTCAALFRFSLSLASSKFDLELKASITRLVYKSMFANYLPLDARDNKFQGRVLDSESLPRA